MNNYVFQNIVRFLGSAMPWIAVFLVALTVSLILVPLVRGMNRRLGLVDQPSARRINKTPVPRGGGLAVFLAVAAACAFFSFAFDRPMGSLSLRHVPFYRYWLPPVWIVLVGYADDKFGLPPLVKLAGQIVCALLSVFLCGFGFSSVFPGLPVPVDAALTVLWFVGAINAFNLIDGLDGLATGLAAIATAGMAGALFCLGRADDTFVHVAFFGALLGFLRYNFHPASVFLGDCGSMYIGYTVAALPLLTASSNSFFVGVGIPLLAMGVPIFDTSLAIVRRTLRAILRREAADSDPGNDRMMTADTDHLHHRILRRVVSQRKAAFLLYGFAGLLVAIGLGGIVLKGRAVALFIVGFMTVAYIVFRDMRRIELWDAGRVLNAAVRNPSLVRRRLLHLLGVPLLVTADLSVLVGAWLIVCAILSLPITEAGISRWLILRAVPMFLALVFFRAYRTVWSRAMLSNYIRLVAAVVAGSAVSCVLIVMARINGSYLTAFTLCYGVTVFLGLLAVRCLRAVTRDLFYALDASHLLESPDIRRVVVYGAGLRYRTFRRELVRAGADARRVIVGILDDDILLRDQYIGGIRICGTLEQAPSVLKRLRADEVVIAARLTPARLKIARQIFASCGIKATRFAFAEEQL